MRTTLAAALSAALLFGGAHICAAETVTGLYKGYAAVTGQREETRTPALPQCFRDVLVQVSGDPRVLADPRVGSLFSQDAITGFSYVDLMARFPKRDEQGTRDRPHELTVTFDPQKIDAALKTLGSKLWGTERPTIVAFVAVRLGVMSYVLDDKSEDGEFPRLALMNAARRYGLPVVLPSQEALKAAGVTFDGLQDADPEATLANAARASGRDMALAGSLTFSDTELGWIADWRLSDGKSHTGEYAKSRSTRRSATPCAVLRRFVRKRRAEIGGLPLSPEPGRFTRDGHERGEWGTRIQEGRADRADREPGCGSRRFGFSVSRRGYHPTPLAHTCELALPIQGGRAHINGRRVVATLLHHRHDEFGAFLDAGRPARRDGFRLGVETERVGAVLVEIAEARALPAAEGVIGQRHRQRHVDPDHADIHLRREIARRVAVAREDRGAVAIGVLGRQLKRLFVVLARTTDSTGPKIFACRCPSPP